MTDNIMIGFDVMVKGMGGIFVIIILIMLGVVLMNKVLKDKDVAED